MSMYNSPLSGNRDILLSIISSCFFGVASVSQARSKDPAYPAWSTPLFQQHKAAKPTRPCLRHRPLRSTRSGT